MAIDNTPVDVLEQDIYALDANLLSILLKDRNTDQNIRWACNEYSKYGENYQPEKQILPQLITGSYTKIIQPRTAKTKQEQIDRTKKLAEVFTPSWICNQMNNQCDEQWFHRKNVFNTVKEKSWQATLTPISFNFSRSKYRTQWMKYVDAKRLEITCGEAPFLVSRYDTTTGEMIPISQRMGILDRKLRVVGENATTENIWYIWAKRAFESTYGYEFQGDNLLLARENLLLTFIDYYKARFSKNPSLEKLKKIAEIISYNMWQMDGLKGTVPFVYHTTKIKEGLFEEEKEVKTPIFCYVHDWRKKQIFKFTNLQGEESMKFDVVIGNPPYQESKSKSETQTQGNSTWIYQYFQFTADDISRCSCLIFPFGGWFDSPERLNGLGLKLLQDKRTVFIHAYEGTTDKRAWYRNDKMPQPIFGINANLSAGVSIVFRTAQENGAFRYFNRMYSDEEVTINYNEKIELTPNPTFIKIYKKLGKEHISDNIKKGIFGIESDYVEKNPNNVSFSEKDWKNPVQLLTNDKSGSSGRATLYWTDKNNIPKGHEYINYYKVIMTSAYPKKTIVSSLPTIANVKKRISEQIKLLPQNSAFGRSRLALFMSKDKKECENFMKYTQTDFFAGLVLQEPNRSASFGLIIPKQDFSVHSDINWEKSIHEIDLQLYKKYGLNEEEISFIETRVKEME